MTWFRIAKIIKSPVRLAKKQIYSREFLKWEAMLEREYNDEFHRMDHLFAALRWDLYKIRKMLGSKEQITFDEMLIKFTIEKKVIEKKHQVIDPDTGEFTDDEKKRRREMGMQFKSSILSAFGFDAESGKRIRDIRGNQQHAKGKK